ncbi:MAG: hypothetical protein A2017_05280 [Lentisphaerae bacterium GWF2_44_16]|nr:MAG: hypothetical protein A2017_05280 [Lentisphaerae bacterium GWF2_44_16]
MKIEDIDSNFKTATISGRKLNFLNIEQKPFRLCGFAWYEKEHKFCRLPESIMDKVNDGVKILAWNTSGGMLRFRTNSKTIAIKAELLSISNVPTMANSGTSGFDIYIGNGEKKKYQRSAYPAGNAKNIESILIEDMDGEMREYTVNFPLYNGIKELSLGFEDGCKIEEPSHFKYQKPVLFYGSSITQGGCASRPGNTYTNILGRRLNAEIINLGFSGSCKGEPAIAEAISSLELSAFVMDYDHNAPSVEYLKNTHEDFFRIVRKHQPELPVIIISRPNTEHKDVDKRLAVIKKTFDNAVSNGDKRVYFINGKALFGKTHRDACTVDSCHPNDLGFMRMAENIYPILKEALNNK